MSKRYDIFGAHMALISRTSLLFSSTNGSQLLRDKFISFLKSPGLSTPRYDRTIIEHSGMLPTTVTIRFCIQRVMTSSGTEPVTRTIAPTIILYHVFICGQSVCILMLDLSFYDLLVLLVFISSCFMTDTVFILSIFLVNILITIIKCYFRCFT